MLHWVADIRRRVVHGHVGHDHAALAGIETDDVHCFASVAATVAAVVAVEDSAVMMVESDLVYCDRCPRPAIRLHSTAQQRRRRSGPTLERCVARSHPSRLARWLLR